MNSRRIPWLGLIAFGLLAIAAAGLANLRDVQRQSLLQSLQSLLVWLPVLYGVVVLSYAGRYWRWRLLLGRLGIGSPNWPDLLGWFRGFALTATPAKVGELTRVQLLCEQLGYPHLPLVHVFVAERLADATAVGLLLLVLVPNQLLSRIPALSVPWLVAIGLVAAASWLLASRASFRRWLHKHLQRWQSHLPSSFWLEVCCPPPLSRYWSGRTRLWCCGCWCSSWHQLRSPSRRPSLPTYFLARPAWLPLCRAGSA